LSVRLYVGNLPPQLCFPELEDLFTPFGTIVAAELMTDPTTGRSRGFGFVELESADAAQAAISALHGSTLDGQVLTVNEANPAGGRRMPLSPSREDGGRSFSASGDRPRVDRPAPAFRAPAGAGTRLFVGNLPYTATAAEIERLFAQAGKVASVSLVTDRATGQSKGFAFVDMGSKEEATAAIQRFDGQEALGRILKVNEARPPERRSGGPSFGPRPGGRR
jgi:RNA recognition motif-containing protein